MLDKMLELKMISYDEYEACRRFLLTYFANASLWVSANQILQNSSLFPHT